jgi:hypothetical protein
MRSFFVSWLFVLAGLLAAAPCLAAAPPELKKLRVLLVLSGAEMKNSVDIDEWRLNVLLRSNIPRDRLEITTLKGDKATREAVLAHYRTLKTNAGEALLFYSSGRCSPDPKPTGAVLEFARGSSLSRSELRKAMEAKKAGLVVILSDGRRKLCRTKVARRMTLTVKPPPALHKTLRCLFFQARDTVDITASAEGPAWGDDVRGGVFTRALCKVLERKLSDLDRDRDGLVTWKEVFPVLEKETKVAFTTWAREWRDRGEIIDARPQKPLAYALGKEITQGERAFAVITIRNKTSKPMRYLYRWSDESRWQKGSIPAEGVAVHTQPLSDQPGELIHLKVQVIDSSLVSDLKASRWSGNGEPTARDGWPYNYRTRK